MDSEKFAKLLGAIVAVAVLAAAFIYVPPGGKPAIQTAAPSQAPAAPAPAAPAPKGPVVREVPQ